MFNPEIIKKLSALPTPFYYYDLSILEDTLKKVREESDRHNYIVHYAVKANANDKILKKINEFGLGADCVSGNEVIKAIETGFKNKDIVYAGVGKTDEEIKIALANGIFSINVESIQELEVINDLAALLNKKAKIALRINPNVNANTHHFITTGLEENKFGLNAWDLDSVVQKMKTLDKIKLTGLHFHIGSQVTDLDVFKELCVRINEIKRWFRNHNLEFEHINAGGGLGVNYESPDEFSIPEFASFFNVFHKFLELDSYQKLHLELGRTIVAQCGSLLSKVIFVKEGADKKFVILDAGMTELIRPALYQSYHKIENLTSEGIINKYDVVGPICETSDTFGKAVMLPEARRGDLFAIRTTGAYGEVMSSRYNLRSPAKAYYSDEILA